jgi:predicted secreted protein
MPTLASHAPAHNTPSSIHDGADFEPDDKWKRKLKQDIEQSFKSMIQEARDHHQVRLKEGTVSQERLDLEYKQTLHNIKALAEEQYLRALMKERNERRWISGVQMLPGWNDILQEEQQNIMRQISNIDNSARVGENTTDGRGTHRSSRFPSTGLYSMPTLSYAPRYTTMSSQRDGSDLEPDEEWKRNLKKDIEQSFKSMIQEARDHHQVRLKEGTVSQERLDLEYKQTLHNIKALAEEQYLRALMKERNERRWISGVQMLPGWNDILHEEQQKIMNGIQTNHSDNPACAAESPTDERDTNGSLPSSAAASAPRHGSESQLSDPPPTREASTRDRAWSRILSSPSTDRRGQDNNTQSSSSRGREDQAPRPTLSENFPDTALTQDPEEQHPRSLRSFSGRQQSNSEKPWDSLLGKSSASLPSISSAVRHHFGHSLPKSAPPIQNPDRRRLSTASQDDPPLPPMQEIYDDGAVPPSSAAAAWGSYGSYRGVVPSPTVMQDDWDYPPRQESRRPSIPMRRREGERRGTIDGGGPLELGSCHSSLSYSLCYRKTNTKQNKKRRQTTLLTFPFFSS